MAIFSDRTTAMLFRIDTATSFQFPNKTHGVNVSLTIGGKPPYRGIGEKEKWSAMNGKTAWRFSAMAFDASRNECVPRLLRRVFLQSGVACYWAALAFEGRAFEVWRELHAQNASARRLRRAAAWSYWVERVKELLEWRSKGQCPSVLAWSLPDIPKMRGLGLGCMWAVLCPFCHDFHTHSPGEGHRTPHCCSDRSRGQYILEFAGALPVEYRTPFYRSSKAGLPRLLHQWPETGIYRPEAAELLAA